MTNTNWKEEWEKHPAKERVIATDSFCTVHGWSEYKGETIPEFIERTIDNQLREVLETVEKMWDYPCHCLDRNIQCKHDFVMVKAVAAIIRSYIQKI